MTQAGIAKKKKTKVGIFLSLDPQLRLFNFRTGALRMARVRTRSFFHAFPSQSIVSRAAHRIRRLRYTGATQLRYGYEYRTMKNLGCRTAVLYLRLCGYGLPIFIEYYCHIDAVFGVELLN